MITNDFSDLVPHDKKKDGMMGGKPKDNNDTGSHKVQRIKRWYFLLLLWMVFNIKKMTDLVGEGPVWTTYWGKYQVGGN